MRKVLAGILAGILIIIMSCTYITFGGSPKKGESKKAITIGVLPDIDSVPFIMADSAGFFKKEGVKVKLVYFKSAKDRDSAIQSGNIDGTVADMIAVLFDKAGGFDVRITSKIDGNYKLVCGKTSGINSLKDIKGKNIAISKNTLIEYSTDKFLEAANLTDKDINKQIIPQIPLRLEMLQNGKVDGAVLPEPLASLAIKNGGKLIYSTSDLGIKPGIIMFTAKIIKANPKELQEVYRAYNDSVKYLNNEPIANFIDVLIKKAGFPEIIRSSIKLPVYSKAAMPKLKDFEEVLSWMKNKGLIKKNYEFKDCSDDSFVR